jgi:hypothetical protein
MLANDNERRSTKEETSVNERENGGRKNEGCRENKGLQERQAPIGSRKRGGSKPRMCIRSACSDPVCVCVPIERSEDCLC